MSKVITILAIGLIAYYWAYTQKLKQLAMQAGKLRCQEAGVQFLDHTVVQDKVGFVKDSRQRWCIQREYLFDFTSTGEHRYQGKVVLQSKHIVSTELDAFLIN
ncbi:DUF3301 domain-containing protein [Aliikangiella maris]|uniref:DUF3301 domain-containing protein n=2 Tax=Aliikangiella maris TaxID=3162458 RepID=A0ABV3MSF4_9GAMM